MAHHLKALPLHGRGEDALTTGADGDGHQLHACGELAGRGAADEDEADSLRKVGDVRLTRMKEEE